MSRALFNDFKFVLCLTVKLSLSGGSVVLSFERFSYLNVKSLLRAYSLGRLYHVIFPLCSILNLLARLIKLYNRH